MIRGDPELSAQVVKGPTSIFRERLVALQGLVAGVSDRPAPPPPNITTGTYRPIHAQLTAFPHRSFAESVHFVILINLLTNEQN